MVLSTKKKDDCFRIVVMEGSWYGKRDDIIVPHSRVKEALMINDPCSDVVVGDEPPSFDVEV